MLASNNMVNLQLDVNFLRIQNLAKILNSLTSVPIFNSHPKVYYVTIL